MREQQRSAEHWVEVYWLAENIYYDHSYADYTTPIRLSCITSLRRGQVILYPLKAISPFVSWGQK